MAIIQVAYEVPDDVYIKLATREMKRFGSVVRDRTGIKLHLKEVLVPKAENSTAVEAASTTATASKSVFSVIKGTVEKHPVAAVMTGVAIGVATAGGIVYIKYKAKKKKAEEKTELLECLKDLNITFGVYLDEIRASNLNENTLDTLMDELNRMKDRNDYSEIKIAFSSEQLNTLVKLVFDYTELLARANLYEVVEIRMPETDATDEAIAGLQECLSIQKKIFAVAS